MAESTKGTVVQDAIWRLLKRSCTAKESGKYLGAVHMRGCDDKCWTTVACTEALDFPVWSREALELSSPSTCDLNDDIIFADYVADRIARADAWALEYDFTATSYQTMIELFESGETAVFVIELNDPDKTQMAFAAIVIQTPTVTVPGRSDTDLTKMTLNVQPTGKYYSTAGVDLEFCS